MFSMPHSFHLDCNDEAKNSYHKMTKTKKYIYIQGLGKIFETLDSVVIFFNIQFLLLGMIFIF